MYQRRSNLQNLMILLLDCLTIVVSLILANYIRNGRLFESDDARMDFGLLLGAVLVVFLAMNLFGSLYRDMMLRGPLHECMCVIRNNAISFAGAAVVLYFMGLLDAYSRLVFFYFLYSLLTIRLRILRVMENVPASTFCIPIRMVVFSFGRFAK